MSSHRLCLEGKCHLTVVCGRLVSSHRKCEEGKCHQTDREWKVSVISQKVCGRLVSSHRKCVEG